MKTLLVAATACIGFIHAAQAFDGQVTQGSVHSNTSGKSSGASLTSSSAARSSSRATGTLASPASMGSTQRNGSGISGPSIFVSAEALNPTPPVQSSGQKPAAVCPPPGAGTIVSTRYVHCTGPGIVSTTN